MLRRILGDEEGAVGGVEVLAFGVLIFITGTLLIANLWAVVDAKMAVDAAAREAGRAHVEAPDATEAPIRARAAAAEAFDGMGRDPDRLVLTGGGPFIRCAIIEYEASYTVDAVRLPFIGGWGKGTTVRARHREVMDAHRSGLGGRGVC